jgi:RNA polymerase II-associated factor 1
MTPEPDQSTDGQNAGERKPEYPEAAAFHFVRDYETVKIDTEVLNEFLLSLNSGVGPTAAGKGAYYKNIERKYVLKKKRHNVRLCLSSGLSLSR